MGSSGAFRSTWVSGVHSENCIGLGAETMEHPGGSALSSKLRAEGRSGGSFLHGCGDSSTSPPLKTSIHVASSVLCVLWSFWQRGSCMLDTPVFHEDAGWGGTALALGSVSGPGTLGCQKVTQRISVMLAHFSKLDALVWDGLLLPQGCPLRQ